VPLADMVRKLPRIPRGLAALSLGALLLLALGGCQLKHPTSNLVTGKKLFVANCGSCHTLSHAGSVGQVGPNLDDAFRQDRVDGVKSTSIQGLVSYWIRYPNSQGAMPANCAAKSPFCLSTQHAEDVAAYVARVAAKPGQDSGALGSAVQQVNQKPVSEQNGTLQIDADPTGQLKFLASNATATPGSVIVKMKNASSVPHDIGVRGAGISQVGSIVQGGGTSSVTVNLKPGTYTFFCSVDGHEAAGMKGTITVK
jgi:plastocyanin